MTSGATHHRAPLMALSLGRPGLCLAQLGWGVLERCRQIKVSMNTGQTNGNSRAMMVMIFFCFFIPLNWYNRDRKCNTILSIVKETNTLFIREPNVILSQTTSGFLGRRDYTSLTFLRSTHWNKLGHQISGDVVPPWCLADPVVQHKLPLGYVQ